MTSIDPTLENNNIRNLLHLEGTLFVGQFLLVTPFIKLSVQYDSHTVRD